MVARGLPIELDWGCTGTIVALAKSDAHTHTKLLGSPVDQAPA